MTRWTDAQVDEIGKLYRSGLSASQIAARMRAPSRNAICGVIARYGLSGTKPVKRRLSTVEKAPRGFGGGSILQRQKRLEDASIAYATPAEPPPRPRGARPTLFELKSDHCRWPFGDPRHPEFHFCGDQKAGTGSYCAMHAAQARGQVEGK